MCENVAGRTISAMSLRGAVGRRRIVAFLLLVIVTYGATVEAAHSHGSATPNGSRFAALHDAGDSHSTTDDSQNRDCVVCRFQQQLFNGVVHEPLLILAPSTQTAFVSTPTVLYSSSPIDRPSGRAPPAPRA
jgi:hypothetical protein